MSRTKFDGNADGFGLLQVLVALGLMGVLGAGLVKLINGTQKVVKRTSLDDERTALFSTVRKSIFCERTYEKLGQPSGQCGAKNNQAIAVYKGDKEFISPAGTKMGNWTVKAFCRNAAGIDVRVAYKGPDPITGAALDFEHPKNQMTPVACLESSVDNEPDLDCVTASRTLNSISVSRDNVVAAFDVGTPGTESQKWGMVCGNRYNRMSCAMTTPTRIPADYDLTMIDRGCASDNDEFGGAFTLQIVCCRLTHS